MEDISEKILSQQEKLKTNENINKYWKKNLKIYDFIKFYKTQKMCKNLNKRINLNKN